MAIKNNRIFGLSVSLSMADILNRKTALTNLGLNIDDLEIIRGSASANFDKNDLQTLSNLTVPVWESFDRYINDISTYSGILEFSGGSDFQLRGNLKVAGQISATAFRYPILDTESTINGNPVLKWGDISTSRVSSWSTIGRTISYGADVSIGGELKTGKLKTRTVATSREFNSEVPTHKIKLRLNGATRYVYAMKGIPLKFRGFFRSFTGTIDIVSSSVKGSWRINRVDGNGSESFADQGTNTRSKLEYSSPFATERDIEFYYNPDQIKSITLSNVNIRSLPKTSLSQLTTFKFSNNGLVDFPNIATFAPALQTLNLANNPFINGSNVNLRKLNHNIRDLLPTTLRKVDLRGCFNGGLQQGTLSTFADLREVYLSRSNDKRFYPDSTNPTGELPLFHLNDQLRVFVCTKNDFRTIVSGATTTPPTKSIKELTRLTTVNLHGNTNLLDNSFTLANSINTIEGIDISRTKLRCPSLPNSSSLRTFSAYENTNFGSLYTNWSGIPGEANTPTSDAPFVFQGCNALTSINVSQSNVKGFIPKFNNLALENIDLRGCNGLIAGRPGKTGADIKCLYNDTFINAANVSSFFLSVNNSSFAGEIESDTFAPVQDSISTLHLSASGRFTGLFPNLESCSALADLRSSNQGWSSVLPGLSAANSIRRIELQSNNFTGSIRYQNRNNLNYLNVSANQLTKIDSSFSAANLEYLYASSNNFSGTFPNLGTACPKVKYVSLNNNSYTNYPKNNGGLSQLTNIKSLDLAVNAFNRSSVDNILFDLVDNYNASPRKGVIVNLSGGNSSPSNYPQITGIVSGFDSIDTGVITSGDINLTTSDFIGDMSNLVPVSGIYSNINLENVNVANEGAGANVSVTMNPVVYENIVTGINISTLPTGTNFTGGIFTDQNPPAGGTAASVIVTVDGNGSITSIALDSPLDVTTRGTGYSQGDTIDIINNSQTINIPVSSIKEYYFTSVTCTVNSINNGGSDYSDNQELQTPNVIRFIDTTTDEIVTRRLKLTVDGTTQRQNTNVVVGITAVDFLRRKGWTINVSQGN